VWRFFLIFQTTLRVIFISPSLQFIYAYLSLYILRRLEMFRKLFLQFTDDTYQFTFTIILTLILFLSIFHFFSRGDNYADLFVTSPFLRATAVPAGTAESAH